MGLRTSSMLVAPRPLLGARRLLSLAPLRLASVGLASVGLASVGLAPMGLASLGLAPTLAVRLGGYHKRRHTAPIGVILLGAKPIRHAHMLEGRQPQTASPS